MRWPGSGPPRPALAALPQVAADLGAAQDTVDRLRADYQEHLDDVRTPDDDGRRRGAGDRRAGCGCAVLEDKRREITRLRDTNEIDDVVLRELQAAIDIEEIRLLGPEMEE